jgi:hypothetical protein
VTAETTAPIFVVGVPRSGTTLLAAMLGAHSRMSCGPETHFFSKGLYRLFASRRLLRSWPRRAAEKLLSTVTNALPLVREYGLGREEVESFLADRAPSARAVLEALTELFMRKIRRQRWVEKTPRHLAHLPEIRRLYPSAPVIRIVRDPRDVALSILRAPWHFHSFVEALVFWQYLDAGSARSIDADPCTLTVRYEDLVLSPEEELVKICQFVGEAYEPGMLDTSQSARQVNRTQEPWKDKVGQPLDARRVSVWESELTAGEVRQAEALVGHRLRAFGYPTEAEFPCYVAASPLHALARYPRFVADAVARGVRFWPARPGELPEQTIYVGHPDADDWLGCDTWTRVRRTGRILSDLIIARLRKERVQWLTAPHDTVPSGYCCRLLSLALPASRPDDGPWRLEARQPANAWL